MKKHDTIATRLSLILTKFNNGEKLTVDELVKEFGVTKRTIQRDINERLSNIPIVSPVALQEKLEDSLRFYLS